MPSIVLEFTQFGDFDSFCVYRSPSPMDINNLPLPIHTGLKVMRYVDSQVAKGGEYYYVVSTKLGSAELFSDQVKVLASNNIVLTPSRISNESWNKINDTSYSKTSRSYSKLGVSGDISNKGKTFEFSFVTKSLASSRNWIALYVRTNSNTYLTGATLVVGERTVLRGVAQNTHQGFSIWLDDLDLLCVLEDFTITEINDF